LTPGEKLIYNVNMRMSLILKSSGEKGGHLQTRQRQLLWGLIQAAGGHIDAKELFQRAIAQDQSVSHATVYRSLNLFRELGLINEKRLGQPQCYYELKQAPEHQHLVCRSCGKVIDFACPLREVVARVKIDNGFTVTRAEVYLEGYCAECGNTP